MHGRLYAITTCAVLLFLLLCAPWVGAIPFIVYEGQVHSRLVKCVVALPGLLWAIACWVSVHYIEKNEYRLFARAFRREVSMCLWSMIEEMEKRNPEQCTKEGKGKVMEYFDQGDEAFYQICKFRTGSKGLHGTDWRKSDAEAEAAWRFVEYFAPEEYDLSDGWWRVRGYISKYLSPSGYKPRHHHLIRIYVLDYFNLLGIYEWLEKKMGKR